MASILGAARASQAGPLQWESATLPRARGWSNTSVAWLWRCSGNSGESLHSYSSHPSLSSSPRLVSLTDPKSRWDSQMEREMERIRIVIKRPEESRACRGRGRHWISQGKGVNSPDAASYSSSASTAESSRFDSGQYSFFGKAHGDLGFSGTVDDAPLDGGYGGGGFGGHDDGAYQLSPMGEEVLAYLSARAYDSIVYVLLAVAECSIV
ncbi:hypothetical protein ZWY2020_026937 [Hordeum vulgare]|nr:hypothetical protein ZWY2020_026937 [Hordeum vulgare]